MMLKYINQKAAFINAAANYSLVLYCSLVSVLFWREYFLPEDYGVIGVLTVFTRFFGACEYGDRHCRYSE